MKHLVRDILIFFFTVTGVAYLYRVGKQRRGPLVRVVAFHDVSDSVWFENVLRMLIRTCNVISPEDFHTGILKKDKINILITFDDGYESWVRTCAPILSESRVSCMFFINSGLLDVSENSEGSQQYVRENLKLSPKNLLTWSGAQTLLSMGHTIGGHTVHHKSLRSMPPHEITEEVLEDKKTIEHKLNVRITDFAYPFGVSRDYSKETETIVRSEGYRYVYVAEPGFVTSLEAHIPRTLIEKGQSLQSIMSWMLGSYDVFMAFKKALR